MSGCIMLLRFAVSNHLSIKDTQELSFIKSALKGPEEGLLSTPALPKDKVLPAAIIYGPNASGKSNLIDALKFMRSAVLSSQREWAPDGWIPRQPFVLSKECISGPSRYEADFDIDGIRYNYGFACTSTQFVEEWLYSSPAGRQRMMFDRTGPNPDNVEFGSSFTGPKQVIAQLMRPNSLFLSAAAQNNHVFSKILAAAFEHICLRTDLDAPPATLQFFLREGKLNTRIQSFLARIGTGITNHRRTETDRPDERSRLLRSVFGGLLDEMDDKRSDDDRKSFFDLINKEVKIEFAHQTEDGEEVFLGSERESAGTRRLIPLLSEAMEALDNGSVCVIDEIDASLHTQVCEAIIALFTNPETNPKGAQIIATTHDTNLLNAPNLRRDELWLVEKSPGGASELYSLADVKARDTDNLERGYLQGRYGAVPFAGSAVDLIKSL
jgi:AAA domain, putative AbiEii toxin, Type IV TA system